MKIYKNICTMNGQSAAIDLSNQQLQVLLTGIFGDGCFYRYKNKESYNFYYSTNCIHKEYIEFKKELLGSLCTESINSHINKGFKNNKIFQIKTRCNEIITKIATTPIENLVNKIDELGLALWFYDDGSLHKNKLFYNLNTQKFSKKTNNDIIVPFLKDKFDITAIPTVERKKDGKEYWYLRIKKYEGAFIISEILNKYYIPCFDYKIISSETILKWSKLQEQLKSTDIDIKSIHPRTLFNMMNKMSV